MADIRIVAALGLAGLLAAGCITEAPRDYTPTHLFSRLESITAFPTDEFPAVDPEGYATQRTVFVVRSRVPVRLIPHPEGFSPARPMVQPIPRKGDANFGIGVVIDPRGYILTASHVAGDTRFLQVIRTDGSKILVTPARRVWRGNTLLGEPDLAVLFVPGGLPQAYAWSETIPSAGPVLGIGASWTSLRQYKAELKFQSYAGTVTKWETKGIRQTWQQLQHSAPSFPGDSGGPLLDARGRLLAISTQGGLAYAPGVTKVSDAEPYGVGVRPDLAWLAQLIEDDVRKHSTSASAP